MEPQSCAARVVVLGASNVALGLRSVFDAARASVGEPFDFFGAFGHGRSYGLSTRVLGRGLSSIEGCGLWSAIARARPAQRSFAILADLGNDVAYGARPREIAGWIEACLERLDGARIVVVGPPLERLSQLGPRGFFVASRILFPGRALDRERTLAALGKLRETVRAAALARGAAWLEPKLAWYGLDPIHIARSRRAAAWLEIAGASDTTRERVRWRGSIAPERRTLLGVSLAREQPCAWIRGGGAIHVY